MTRRTPFASLAVLSLTVLSGCVDGDLVGLDGVAPVAISAVPVFAILPTADELAQLDLLRVKLHGIGDTPLVLERPIDASSEGEWELTLQVEVTVGRVLSLFLETELIDTDGVLPSVEWSGRTSPFPVRASFDPIELRQVDLYRGPLANLGLTHVDFGAPSLRMVEDATSTLRWSVAGDTTGARLYLRSLDPSVVTVDANGLIRGESKGTTDVVIFGGTVADTISLAVESVVLPTVAEFEAVVSPSMEYVVSDLFVSTFQDGAGASAIRESVATLATAFRDLEPLAVIDSYEAAKSAWRSYGSGSSAQVEDGPQLGVVELALILIAHTLQTGLP
ncbi:MAG TPA: hypothetical protein VMM35_00500 [Longimicrobiales bacterium]|nr:hypothetical protein [Longimicrobiales bacterium]